MRQTVCLLLLGCYAVRVCESTATTTPAPTLTTAAAADPQKEYHCSDKPSSMCGPRVLRCQLIKACNCTMTPSDLVSQSCECCKDCVSCLGPYLTECCACVGLCELTPPSEDALEAEAEEAEDLTEYEIEHFDVVREALGLFERTFAPMLNQQWQMYVYSIVEEPGPLGSRLEKDVARSLAAPADNCTVVYLDECISRKACAQKCKVLMASSFRWFVTGCCECAGEHCLAGGSTKARCNHCRHEDFPHIDEDEEEEVRGIIPNQLKEL